MVYLHTCPENHRNENAVFGHLGSMTPGHSVSVSFGIPRVLSFNELVRLLVNLLEQKNVDLNRR